MKLKFSNKKIKELNHLLQYDSIYILISAENFMELFYYHSIKYSKMWINNYIP